MYRSEELCMFVCVGRNERLSVCTRVLACVCVYLEVKLSCSYVLSETSYRC